MGFLEDLRSATPSLQLAGPAWDTLKDTVRTATGKAQLRRAEDPVDAVLCAYIARYAHARPADITVYGDIATGCIVTPALR
jgi:predicted RNase H-like nuclease